MESLLTKENLKIQEMKNFLKEIGSFYSYKNKKEYNERLLEYKKLLSFPWRTEQREVIETFIQHKHKNYVIHGNFGVGKSTMLIGMVIRGLLNGLFKPEDIFFVSFNISTKNEINRRLRKFGIAHKVSVRTFDSVIYEICKIGKYEYIDLPNFEGKRKFVYEKVFCEDFDYYPVFQPKIIFLDECQDLEKQMLDILYRFYPKTKFVFAGDIFQSIQKEPRESILWHFMVSPNNLDTYKIYMNITPRVPKPILDTLKNALSKYYTEFNDKIKSWESSNTISNANVVWKQLDNYTTMFSDLKDYLGKHKPEETMILTFSSAITVRGNNGDVARIRRFLSEQNIKVNMNHKKQEEDSYFLSTANSSKGLERDYVIIFLTFPLERAFVHLSDDVILNLITVALSRCKKEVVFYVPKYSDKFCNILNLFTDCPLPDEKKVREGKIMKDFNYSDYINIEHTVTELIRASVIKYDTRIVLQSYAKFYKQEKMFEDIHFKIPPILSEEEKSFVGILIENLITSTWKNGWPFLQAADKIENNPMYIHVANRIKKNEALYNASVFSKPFNNENQFQGIYLFSQICNALSNKLFINLSKSLLNSLEQYWKLLKPKIITIKPVDTKIQIQSPVKMGWITGIADVLCLNPKNEVDLYEIKASKDKNWRDDALLQAIMYSLMTGHNWSRIHLINPFQNEKVSYHFNSKKILILRNELFKDLIIYNTNSMMAKMYPMVRKENKPELAADKLLFLDIRTNSKSEIYQVSIINLLSPIKCEVLYNKFISCTDSKKNKNMTKQEKSQCESETTFENVITEINTILNSNILKDKIIYSFKTHKEIKNKILSISELYSLNNITDILTSLNYTKHDNYSLDIEDSLCCNILCLSYLFFNNKFI